MGLQAISSMFLITAITSDRPCDDQAAITNERMTNLVNSINKTGSCEDKFGNIHQMR